MPVYGRLLLWFLGGTLNVTAHRVYFAARFHTTESAGDVLTSLFAGLRFDLAAVPIVVGPYLLLDTLLNLLRGRVVDVARRALITLQLLWFAVLNMSLYSSTFNYGVNEKLLGWEYFAYFNDLPALYRGILEKDILSGMFYVAVPAAAVAFAVWFFRREGGFASTHPVLIGVDASLKKAGVVSGLVLTLAVCMRGGFQQSPLRTADAMKSDSAYLNNLRLNGIFTVLNDSRDSLEFKTFYDRDENIQFVNSFLGSGKISQDYPLIRRMPPRTLASRQPVKRPNIVLVVIESFTSKFLAAHEFDPSVAPRFNALSSRGVYFTRFFATGGRSANGLFAMFSGIPDRAGRTILRSSQIQNRFGGLAGILSSRGYRTFFVHGGDLKFDNLNTALPHLGFAQAYGRDEIGKTGFAAQTNVLGYDDRDVFRFFLQQMDRGGPFFGAVFTQNTHYPYVAPDYKEYSKDRIHNLFLSSYHYVDSVIGDFAAELETRPYAKDTIVLFVADHTHHAGLNYLEDRSIPLLVYAPAMFAPARVDFVASQLDILPGILSLSGGDVLYASMGNDPFFRAGLVRGTAEFAPEPFAFFAGGSNTNVIGWIEGNRLAVRWLDRETPLFLTAEPPLTGENLTAKEPDRLNLYSSRMRHFQQYARTLEKENRIWPEPDVLEKLEKAK